jgi:hypothetical protein
MERLSGFLPIKTPTPSAKFAAMMHTTKAGTELGEIDEAWDKVYTNHPLVPILVKNADGIAIDLEEAKINFNSPYLWSGKCQGGHCALVYFYGDYIVLSHSQYIPGTWEWYRQTNSYSWLLTNTYCIWKVK